MTSALYTTLTPRLVVDNAADAVAFYIEVFGAVPGMKIEDADGKVLHAELDVAGLRMSITEADGSLNRSPGMLGGSPVILTLMVDDPDDIEQKVRSAGGTVIIEVADRYYGMRDGRFADPSGHVWLVTKMVEHVGEDELARRSQQ